MALLLAAMSTVSTAAIPIGPVAYDADHYVWNEKFVGKVDRPEWVVEPDLTIDPSVLTAVR